MKVCRLAVATLLPLCISRAQASQTSPIALSPDETIVAAVDQDSAGISLWSPSGDGPVRFVAVGQEPRTLAFSPDGGIVWVARQSSETLDRVVVAEGKTTGTLKLGGQPYGVLLSADGRRAFVSRYAGGYVDGRYHAGLITVVDLETLGILAHVPVKARPWAMALGADGKSLLITHYLNIDGQGWVTEIDARKLRVVREIPLREDDGVTDGQGGVFNALASIAIHPSGRRALVAGMHANVRRGASLNGQPLSHKTTVQAAIRVIDLEAGRELHDARIVSSFSGQAVAVPSAVSFIGSSELYIDVYFASNDFKIIQYNERGLVAERALRSLPAGPTGVAIVRDGTKAFFSSRWDRSISQLSLSNVREPTLVKTIHASAEPWEARRIQGAILFHDTRNTRMTANRWMSCGVCHLDGGVIGDGLGWDLTAPGARPKVGNTMDLFHFAETSPPCFHRGSPDVVEDLERFVHVFHQGSGFAVPSPEWDAIFAYVGALRPRPNPHMDGARTRGEIRVSAERGRRLFLDPARGCVHCHGGPALTISGRSAERSVFDVGTGKDVDTPTLLELWDTAPYLHDGRAATLHDVLTTHNRQDRHGKTSDLDAGQLADLANFLLAPSSEETP